MKNKLFYFIILTSIFACNKNELKIDVSNIDLDFEVYRFDQDFFNVSADSIFYTMPKIRNKNVDFFDIYSTQVIGVGLLEQKEYLTNLSEFFFYCDQMNMYNEVTKKFPSKETYLNENLTQAFKHYKYYFPNVQIPSVITCISGFNLSVFTSESFIAVSLDKYLGSDFEPYKKMFDAYIVRRMHKEMIPIDVMRAWCVAKFPYNDSSNTLMNKMIYEGRVQYFLDAMLPETEDTLKWGYTNEQWGWANAYESNSWDFMVTEKLPFTNKAIEINTFVGEAPFTSPFRNNSAPRMGTFLGYKIVQSFLKNNKDITLEQLMRKRDYMDIYNKSYYKP